MSRIRWATVAVVLAAGCATPQAKPQANTVGVLALGEIATDPTGRCFARTQAQTQTTVVTELVEVVPEVKDRNGVVTSAAVFRNVTRPQTVEVGQGEPFETVCPQVYTAEFVATLQRALIVRRAYAGAVNGVMDAGTSTAVQAFQAARGIDSPLVAVSVARELGIVAVPRTAG